MAHLVVQLHYKEGRIVKTQNAHVTFEFTGNGRWLGVDNGASANVQNFQSNHLDTAKGRALAIIQSTKDTGMIKVTAKIKGFEDQTLILTSH